MLVLVLVLALVLPLVLVLALPVHALSHRPAVRRSTTRF